MKLIKGVRTKVLRVIPDERGRLFEMLRRELLSHIDRLRRTKKTLLRAQLEQEMREAEAAADEPRIASLLKRFDELK